MSDFVAPNDFLDHTSSTPGGSRGKRPRVAWFSPLSFTGEASDCVGAYVSDLLLPLLSKRFDVELFHDSFEKHPLLPTHHYLAAHALHRENPFDIFFYQVEDHRRADFVRIHLGLIPGIVLFHDFLIAGKTPETIVRSPWQEVIRHYQDSSIEWQPRSEDASISVPFALREAGLAVCTLFSSARDAGEYRRQVKSQLEMNSDKPSPGFLLPLPIDVNSIARKVSKHAKDSPETIVGFCGSPALESRAHKLLDALSQCGDKFKLIWLLDKSQETAACDLLSEFEIRSFELYFGRSPKHWQRISAQLDLAVHTLFSVFGQPDPYLSISMSTGLGCIVTDFSTSHFLPDKAVFKVKPGDTESAQIREILLALKNEGGHRSFQAAIDYAREHHDHIQIANNLLMIFEDLTPMLAEVYSKWDALESSSRTWLLEQLKLDANKAIDEMPTQFQQIALACLQEHSYEIFE